MKTNELETEAESIERAIELLDRLLATADGGRGVLLRQYDASTIVALLMDKKYRVKVTSRLGDFANADSDA